MIILALDLSTKSTGFAIGTDEGKIIKSGCITASQKDVMKRIVRMRDSLTKIIQQNKIEQIVMEEVLPEFNSHTSKVLMWLQAAITIAAYETNSKIKCEYISPTEWRKTLKIKQGRGIKRQTLKKQDIEYVQKKYNITVNDDQADAICIFDAYNDSINNEINWE